ncbi:MAG: helix-turn-helix domain-containing protein [Myxococcaceae bacterium]
MAWSPRWGEVRAALGVEAVLPAVREFSGAQLADVPPYVGFGPQLYRLLGMKAAQDYCIPGTTRTRVAEETLRTWLRLYRLKGFEALKPKPRKDAGDSRALPQQEVKDLLVSIKDQGLRISNP